MLSHDFVMSAIRRQMKIPFFCSTLFSYSTDQSDKSDEDWPKNKQEYLGPLSMTFP